MVRTLSGALCAMAWAGSLEVGAQAPASQAAPTPVGRRYVAIGCVSREAPGPSSSDASTKGRSPFLLTDPRGDSPTVYRLEGDEAQLTFHVGHTIKASGPLSVPPAGGAGPNANALVMKVSAMAYLSPTCPKPK